MCKVPVINISSASAVNPLIDVLSTVLEKTPFSILHRGGENCKKALKFPKLLQPVRVLFSRNKNLLKNKKVPIFIINRIVKTGTFNFCIT